MTLATGSGLPRFVNCRASSVLPRVWHESSDDAEGGNERHAYLERISNGMSPEESLLMVPAQHRDSCEDIDIDALRPDLQLAAEVTLVYHPATDTARILGQSLARDYSDVAEDEVPMTLDLVGVDLERRVGQVGDYKSGFRPVDPTKTNWQLLGGSLALARVYDLDEVDGQIIYTRTGRRDRAVFGPADLLVAAAELREVHARALRDREAYSRGEHIEPTEGSWCRYCPSAWSCPAKTGLIRAALAGEIQAPPRPIDAARLRPRIREAIKLLTAVDAEIVARAAVEPIHVETAEDGTEVWLGEVIGEGNEKLDAKIAIPIAVRELGVAPEDAASFIEEVADLKLSKSSLEDAIKARVPRGQGAATKRRILDEIRLAGGVTRPPTKTVTTFTLPARAAR